MGQPVAPQPSAGGPVDAVGADRHGDPGVAPVVRAADDRHGVEGDRRGARPLPRTCAGTATLTTISAVRGSSIRKGAVLAKTSVRLTGGKRSTLRLVAKGKLAKALPRDGVERAKLSIRTGQGPAVVRTVRLV